MVVDPWGDVVAQMSDKLGNFLTEIDLDYVDKVREDMDCLAHMKRDLFAKMGASLVYSNYSDYIINYSLNAKLIQDN